MLVVVIVNIDLDQETWQSAAVSRVLKHRYKLVLYTSREGDFTDRHTSRYVSRTSLPLISMLISQPKHTPNAPTSGAKPALSENWAIVVAVLK